MEFIKECLLARSERPRFTICRARAIDRMPKRHEIVSGEVSIDK
jgi:hypothetical protein